MPRKLLLAFSVTLLLPWALSADIIVLKNGRRVEAQGPYRISQGMVRFTAADGTELEYPVDVVDLLSTEKATAQARRRTARKVWTNDDLTRLRGGAVSFTGATAPPAPAAAEEAPAGAAEGAAAEGEPEPEPPKEETREYWQERLQALQDQIQQIDQQIQSLQSSRGQAGSNALNVAGSNPGVQVEDTIQRLQAQRRQLQQQISDLQDEARRQGVSPSWVR
jgi:hypothetical protein